MRDEYDAVPAAGADADGQARGFDVVPILLAVLGRWKLIATLTIAALLATYGLTRFVPPVYKSTVEILLYDPQSELDATVQKPVSPFVDALSYGALTTEINIIKSKSVTLRVAKELRLDEVPEFQTRDRVLETLKWLGLSRLASLYSHPASKVPPTKAEKLNDAADALQSSLEVWSDAYVLFVSVSAHSPVMAQRIAAAIAQDYLASQRETRQQALERAADWLKGRVDDLRSRMLKAEATIEEFKARTGISDTESNPLREQQLDVLNKQILAARERVEESRYQLDQARRLIDSHGDLESIPELAASATLTKLNQKKTELSSHLDYLRRTLGNRHVQVTAARAALTVLNKQINAEGEHILAKMQNAYDLAMRQQKSLEASLQHLSDQVNPEDLTKLQQLKRIAEADRSLYQSYLSQYNDVSQRRTLQYANARIISPAGLPKAPSSSRRKKFYAAGGAFGLGSGFLLALVLELLRPGIRTCSEVERTFGLPVVGVIPELGGKKGRRRNTSLRGIVDTVTREPNSQVNQAVHAMRIGLEIADAEWKVILVTSATPAEGKSTTAALLAASSSSSGKRAVLLDCDLHQQSASGLVGDGQQVGLSELLMGKVGISEVIVRDPLTKTYVIPAGFGVPNAADYLMSKRMRELIAQLRDEFDYIVLDAPPLLPIVDSLVLATIADKVLVIVAWDETARASISEAFKLLRPESHRVAGVVLNKVDLRKLPNYGYGPYYYRGAVRN